MLREANASQAPMAIGIDVIEASPPTVSAATGIAPMTSVLCAPAAAPRDSRGTRRAMRSEPATSASEVEKKVRAYCAPTHPTGGPGKTSGLAMRSRMITIPIDAQRLVVAGHDVVV